MPRRLRITLSVSLGLALFCSLSVLAPLARAEPCFAVDADGLYDKDGLVNGIITVTAMSLATVPAAATPYDCMALDFIVESGGMLALEGDAATGDAAQLRLGTLTIDAGGSIVADGRGCPSFFTGLSGPGGGPDASNICVTGGDGAGDQGDHLGGSGGGGHGGQGGNGTTGDGGSRFDSARAPAKFGASGGNTGAAMAGGGTGGGIASINASTITHNGTISANGLNGGGTGGRVTGGGSGGTVSVSAGTINGTTGTFEASGGNGVNTAGGGGGGRIAIEFFGGTFDFDASDFNVTGGSGGGTDGEFGTVSVTSLADDSLHVFFGFTFADEDIIAASWIADDSAVNQRCDDALGAGATPSITANDVTLGGSILCDQPIASLAIAQNGAGGAMTLGDNASINVNGGLTLGSSTTFDIGTGVALANSGTGNDLTLDITDGDDQTWNGVSIDAAPEGHLVMNAAIDLALTNATMVSGNIDWPLLGSLSIDATSSIDADSKGCQSIYDGTFAMTGLAPDCSNSCIVDRPGSGQPGNDFGGAGAGGYGGAGGDGTIGTGGISYGAAADPQLFGASGGDTGLATASGGSGGGIVKLSIAGTFTNDGLVSAGGGDGGGTGDRVSGAGAGGTVRISTNEYACTTGGSFLAAGGNGVARVSGGGSGGGGGGRITVTAATDTCLAAPLMTLTPASNAPGGTGGDTAETGSNGTIALSPVLTCGDPSGVGGSQDFRRTVSASDALFTLQAAVGSRCCNLCVCDTDDSSDITATDALTVLKLAVGQGVVLACPVCS